MLESRRPLPDKRGRAAAVASGDLLYELIERTDPSVRRDRVSLLKRIAVLSVATCSTVAGTALCWSYRRDCARLRGMAVELVTGATTPSERVLAVLHWVYQNKSSRRNPHYFMLRRLGATPLQVAAGGGDCADRSRLMVAMLRELDVPATMAMCFNPTTGDPAHTFVEARVENGMRMAVDPSYCLYFPRTMHSGFHGLLDLRGDPTLVTRRVDELLARQPGAHPADRYYMQPSASFRSASTYNWNKNAMTRGVHRLLKAIYGDAIYCIPRPAMLEEPKLLLGMLSLAVGLASLVVGMVAGWSLWRRAWKRYGQEEGVRVAAEQAQPDRARRRRDVGILDVGVAPDGVSVSG